MIELALGARAVLFTGHAGLQRTQAAQLALHRNAAGMSHVDDTLGDVDVVFIGGRRLHVLFQRTVHHHRRKTELDRALAYRRAGTMVLVHDDRDMRPLLDRRENQVAQERRAGVFARAGRGLHDHRAVGFVRGFHDGAHLFEIVDVERRNTISMFRGVVQQLA